MLKPLLAALICAGSLRAGAPLDLRTLTRKTLPPEAYRLLEKGGGRSSLSWSWKDKSLDASVGFRVEQTRWVHDERNGFLFDYLRDQLELEARKGAPNLLSLQVTYYSVDSVGPQLMLEGTLTEGGKAKAYFVESVILDPGDSTRGLVDEFMQDFAALLK
jgi:hypothetical protein